MSDLLVWRVLARVAGQMTALAQNGTWYSGLW